jgi:hypothetical protein
MTDVTVGLAPSQVGYSNQPQKSWSSKLLQVTVALSPNVKTSQPITFAQQPGIGPGGTPYQGGANTITFPFLRTSARLNSLGSLTGQSAHIRIWGLTLAQMYQLATLGISYDILPYNFLTLQAGDASGLYTVFSGTIRNAYADFSSQPDVPFIFDVIPGPVGPQGLTSGAPANTKTPAPTSFQGNPSVVNILSGLARQLGYGFINGGVDPGLTLSNPYFSGTLLDQVRACARAVSDVVDVQLGNVNITIFPRGGSISSTVAPIISAKTGMIDYPLFTTQGVIVKTLFNPNIARGAPVQIGSSVLQGTLAAVAAQNSSFQPPQTVVTADGTNSVWVVYRIDAQLDSQLPNGQWMETVYCYNPGFKQGTQPYPTPPTA